MTFTTFAIGFAIMVGGFALTAAWMIPLIKWDKARVARKKAKRGE